MKRLEVFLLPPRWDASPSQGYPPALNLPVPIYTPGWRQVLWELSVLPKNMTQCPRPRLEPGPLALELSALTMRPPCPTGYYGYHHYHKQYNLKVCRSKRNTYSNINNCILSVCIRCLSVSPLPLILIAFTPKICTHDIFRHANCHLCIKES